MFLNIFCLQKRECILCCVEHVGIFGQLSLLAAAMFSINYSSYEIGASDKLVFGLPSASFGFLFLIWSRVNKLMCSFQTKTSREQLDFVVLSC